MNGRIEREGLCFSDDSRLAQLVNSAKPHRWYHKVDWFAVGAFLGLAAFLWVFWWQVARAF